MKQVHLSDLQSAALHRRPGYLEAICTRGQIQGDIVHLSDADYEAIRCSFRLPGRSSEGQAFFVNQRFDICKKCPQSKDAGFGCVHHTGCCFGSWREKPKNKCPEGKW